jgi:alkanesulfonate monooxygenase SsuD/methylene tetrahydromethanopterin reductase-like flavin-dependent oxidoreductase (luciferase family)
MLLNCLFPTRDIGTDPAKIRDWAQAAEDLGYHGIEVADHVFGAAPRGDWKPTYSEHDPFHETFTTMAFIAAVTKTIKLCSGVLILPQRQTGVVAKQAAEVDILSGGRLRLGVGVGWNHVEYEALGMEWKTRGARHTRRHRLHWAATLGCAGTSTIRIRSGATVVMPEPPVWLPRG